MSRQLRYLSLDRHLRGELGEKVQKITLDAGSGCPNRDGTLSVGAPVVKPKDPVVAVFVSMVQVQN